MKRNYCVLFAMGGVLIETATEYKKIWKRLGDKYGAETDYLENVVKEKNIKTVLAKYFSHLSDSEKQSLENELTEFEGRMEYNEIPGANRFVRELKDNNVKMGVVSNYSDKQLRNVFDKTGLDKLMDTVVSYDDVSQPKPSPEGYLKAAQNLGYDPKDCYVFEDSFMGIEAAKKAGMNVIALPSDHNRQALANIADRVIPNFTGFFVSDLDRMHNDVAPEGKEKKGMGWLWWILALIALIAIFFLWRTCKDDRYKTENNAINDTSVVVSSTAVEQSAVEDARNADELQRAATELQLPNGTKMQAYKDGMEDRLVTYLKSDDYKNAKEADLKDKWFDFDNIEFVHGSATQLTEASYPQLNNIAEILKHYKDSKVKVGGYTDKTGNPEGNMKLSKERAETIKKYLTSKGVNDKNIQTEGYGETRAKYPADAPDTDRAHDRKIALRFIK